MPSDRRARKRQRKVEAEVEEELLGLIVCDRCGLLQPFRANVWDSERHVMAPCEGPLGLPCDGETASYAVNWPRVPDLP